MAGNKGSDSLLREEGMRKLEALTELDYMTHIVFRMYENKGCVSLQEFGPLHNSPTFFTFKHS